MRSESNPKKTSPATKYWKRALLAGTCLGGVSAADAGSITEPPDFSNTLVGAVAAPAPVGTTSASGSVAFVTDLFDFVDFQSLQAGTPFTLTFTAMSGLLDFSVTDSAGAFLGTPSGSQVDVGGCDFHRNGSHQRPARGGSAPGRGF